MIDFSSQAKASLARRVQTAEQWHSLAAPMAATAEVICTAIQSGGAVFACGNGGSASQADHFVAELVGRFKLEREGFAAVSLVSNPATITAVANDYGFQQVFVRQLAALAGAGDVLFALSTSGNSPNVLAAAHYARANDIHVIGLTGANGGDLAGVADTVIRAPRDDTALVQEVHLAAIHVVCELVELAMTESKR